MAKRVIITILLLGIFTPILSIDFDTQRDLRDSILRSIDENKIIVNKKEYFEDIPWGTSIKNVKSMESRRLLNETTSELDYEVKIDSLTAILAYAFKGDKLDSVMLLLREEDNFDVYNVEYSDILYNLTKEMELVLGKPVYTDTLREKHIKRYPTNNPEIISSITFIWNFINTKVTATKTGAPGLPVIITYKSKEKYEPSIVKKDLTYNKKKGWIYEHRSVLGVGIIILIAL